MIDLENGILLHNSEQDQHAESGIKIQTLAEHPQGEQREGNGNRQCKQNGEWMREALEQRRQNHVHEDHG